MKILSMKEGIPEAKSRVTHLLDKYGQAAVLVSGLSGSGKSTLAEVLYRTQFGGLVRNGECEDLEEIKYSKEGGQFIKGILEGSFPAYNSNLYIANICGAGEVKQVLGQDPRVFVMKLDCDPWTRFTNIAIREWSDLETTHDGSPIKVAKSVVRQYLSHNQKERRFTDEHPDIIVDTSSGSRLKPCQVRRLICSPIKT